LVSLVPSRSAISLSPSFHDRSKIGFLGGSCNAF
jgi:hypothetical protein